MRDLSVVIVIVGCFAALFLGCYTPALFHDRQFAYRDSAHYYYPLYQRVQEEWNAGRWPLWECEENAGTPLLGNPAAAVLYPGKIVFAFLPYAWAARAYIIAHTALAFGAMLVLMRATRTTWTGSTISALAYSFGAPVLFQYCNVVYLVGAAWLPLGFHAIDQWVRRGCRWALLELAIVLAMQTLGGDPQSAFLLCWAGAGYAALLAWAHTRRAEASVPAAGDAHQSIVRVGWPLFLGVIVLAIWIVATITLAKLLPQARPTGSPPQPLPWMDWMPLGVSAVWGFAGLAMLFAWRRRGWQFPLGITCLGLVLSAALALILTAAQLLPVLELAQQTVRNTALGPRDLYGFAIEPVRLLELIWPNVFGSQFQGNTYWRDAWKLPGPRPQLWSPSLYLGGFTIVLASSALGLWRGPTLRAWLSAIVIVSLLGSLGPYTSPIWGMRAAAELSGSAPARELTRNIGPLDAQNAPPIRPDGFLHDGDGGVYWWLTYLLPGFRQFRYPAKLFTFTAFGLAALAGLGWDDLEAGRVRHLLTLVISLAVLSVLALAIATIQQSAILTAFRTAVVTSLWGPFEPDGGYRALIRSLAHAGIIFGLGGLVVRLILARPQMARAIALVVMTVDLALANAGQVMTVPQADLESKPRVVQIIEDLEKKEPSRGPFRVDRLPEWHPRGWRTTRSLDRNREMVTWERDTLQAKYGVNFGLEYTHTIGTAELYDFESLFAGFPAKIRTVEAANALGVDLGREVFYYPRRCFDMWNTRYFVLPCYPHGWRDPSRAYAAFWFRTEQVYPEPESFGGPENAEAQTRWAEHQDFQVRRNLDELPRAWAVHAARWVGSLTESSRPGQLGAEREMFYAGDPIWHDPTMVALNPRMLAWVDHSHQAELAPYLSGKAPRATEIVKVTYPTPTRALLDVTLESAGLVVLADVYYPGWELTIDGRPAPIYAVNRLMRGAAVAAGHHHLVYTYAPRSFAVGRVVSVLGLIVLGLLGAAVARWPVDIVVRSGACPLAAGASGAVARGAG
jgi:hypothetical protein